MGLREMDRFARDLVDVSVVQEPVKGPRRAGFRHELIKAGWIKIELTAMDRFS